MGSLTDTGIFESIVELKTIYDYNVASIPAEAGIYCFWWKGDIKELEKLHRSVALKGKLLSNERTGEIERVYAKHEITWNWKLDIAPVCLYVGKASNISKRIKLLVKADVLSENWYSPFSIHRNGSSQPKTPDAKEEFLVKRTTSCQFRSGLEHLYKKSGKLPLEERMKFIGVSWLLEEGVVERFYLEDLAIGCYRPWFNVDSER